MSALIQPITLLLIIAAGYLFKRFGLFGDRDYRVIQKAEFNLILPGAIIYSFATNPHDVSLLVVSAFAFVAALVPTLVMYVYSRRRPVADRAFLMLNGSGYNVGCFCFPVLQSLIGPAALVPAAMFDVGNCVMVSAGTNVMTQTLLHIAERSYHYMFRANTLEERELCDVLIEAEEFGLYKTFDLDNVDVICDIGYTAAVRAFERILSENKYGTLVKAIAAKKKKEMS